jgi:hypothetical protein
MAEQAETIDIMASAELQRLAEQVQRSGRSVRLVQDGKVIAVVQPAPDTDDVPPTDTFQRPDQFFAEAIARPDVAEILRRLAQ